MQSREDCDQLRLHFMEFIRVERIVSDRGKGVMYEADFFGSNA